MLKSEKKSLEDCVEALEEYLAILFPDIIRYCKFMLESVENKKLLPSLLLHDYNYAKIIDILTNAENSFKEDSQKYVTTLLNNNENVFTQLLKIVKIRQNNPKTIDVDKKLKGVLIKGLLYNIFSSLKGRVSKRTIKSSIRRILFKQNRSIRFVSASYIVNNLLNWIDNLPKNKPFFAWIHTADIHEQNFTSYDIPNGEDMVREEVASLHKLYSDIVLQKHNYYGYLLYDFAIKYTDTQIGRLIKLLKDRNLLDDTLIVLTADHGHTSTEWPIRKDIHIARDFYDELYHVPIAFINKDIQARKIEGMYSSLDIIPTLLDLLRIPIPPDFRGMSVNTNDGNGREYVIMEHLGPGPCDFISKPAKICVRSKTHKLLYETFLHLENHNGRVSELYNLLDDPLEQKNLAEGKDTLNDIAVKELLSIAKERSKEIQGQIKR
jgi:hypothetical protein